MSNEEQFIEYQKQQTNVTANLPKDYEKQLKDAELTKEFEAYQKKEDRRSEFNKERERQAADRKERERKEAEQKQKEKEDRASKLREVEEKLETAKRNQYDAEKALEFKQITAKNEARIKATESEKKALMTAKTGTERIKIRRGIEARQRSEAERIAAENKPLQEYKVKAGGVEHTIKMDNKGLINKESIKGSIRKAIQKTPGVFDTLVTGVFTKTVDRFGAPTSPKQAQNLYRQETQQMSRATKGHAKFPLTGGKVAPGQIYQTPVVSKNAILVNPNYMSDLLGIGQQNPKKKGKQTPSKGGLSGLDDFVRRL